MYKILAVLGLIGGTLLLIGYGMDRRPETQTAAVAGVVLVIIGVLSTLIAFDAQKTRKARSAR